MVHGVAFTMDVVRRGEPPHGFAVNNRRPETSPTPHTAGALPPHGSNG